MRSRLPDPASVALSVLLVVISWHSAWDLGGPALAVGYAVAVSAAVVVGLPWATGRLHRAPPGVVPALVVGVVVGVVVALVVAFVVGVPAPLHHAMGVGSDRANALDVALSQLVAGRYPYAATTYLGNPITPLPGALVLAAPFWWLTGSSAWQNVAWTVLLLGVVGGGRRPGPTLLWALVVVAGLEVLREFLVGDDLVTGAVPAVAASAWTLHAARCRSTPTVVAAAAVLGVATCTRPHLALVVVIVTAAVGVIAGRRRAGVVGATAGLVWAALIVPFLLGGVARFSPLHVAAKVTGDRGVTPAIVVLALAAAALVYAALVRLRPSSPEAVGWLAAAVLAAPTVLSATHRLVAGPTAELDLTLGAVAVPFVMWAMASRARDDPRPSDEETPAGLAELRPGAGRTSRASAGRRPWPAGG